VAEIVGIPSQPGSHLCDVRIIRRPDGTIHADVLAMDGRLIETTGAGVVDRLVIVAGWVEAGAASLIETSRALEVRRQEVAAT
jgi:hypothetical protein